MAIASCLIFLIGAADAAGAPADTPAPAAGDNLILDRNGYFRQYVEFGLLRLNGNVLRSEGEKLLGSHMGQLERDVKRLLRFKGYDWTKTDWRDVARYHTSSVQWGDDTLGVSLMPAIAPPADWAKPDFDDSSFLRQWLGTPPATSLSMACMGRETFSLNRQGLYVRTYFEVPDPAGAGELTVKVVYRGGARLLINGEEIARANLPQGEVTTETCGDDYPLAAYQGTEDELPTQGQLAAKQKRWYGNWVGDLRWPFEAAPMAGKEPGDFRSAFGGSCVNRKGWERMMALRDRALGPVRIPAERLVKGRNVLAIQLRTSRYHPAVAGSNGFFSDFHEGNASWPHLALIDVELRSTSKTVPSCGRRPGGSQVWVDDMHTRLYDRDFNPSGWPVGAVRWVAAQNGTFAAQIGVGTTTDLTGLKAVCSDLSGPEGAKIPSAAVRVQYLLGRGLDEMGFLGWHRSFPNGLNPCPMAEIPLYRYGDALRPPGELPNDRNAGRSAQARLLKSIKFFDEVGDQPPATIPANTCQPIWLSLKVPADAPPGAYKGTVTVRADGRPPQSVPVEAEVIGWRVPDPLDFQTVIESEQSPYGVATAYGIGQATVDAKQPPPEGGGSANPPLPRGAIAALWSDRHFELIESSFKQLARLGNDWVFVPVLLRSELGNLDDGGMIRWIRGKDGALRFDYTVLDRYLALARKHLGKPKVICFVIMHGWEAPSQTHAVSIVDEASGKTETVELGKAAGAAREELWSAFGGALAAHMRALGLEDSMYWGHAFDETPDPDLIKLMARVTPGVGWAAGAHMRRPDATFRAVSAVMGPDLPLASMNGWKNPFLYLLIPRTCGSVICVEGTSTPFTWRVMCDRAIYVGMNGLGRVGADYFDGTWGKGILGYNIVGRACVQTLWPGTDGIDSSTRNEALLEGIQEAEARIFLEQALDHKVLPEAVAKEVDAVLTDHYRATLYIPTGTVEPSTMDQHGDWQGRSRRLFRTAAAVAGRIGVDVDRVSLGPTQVSRFAGSYDVGISTELSGEAVTVPALGRTRLVLKLRNWTAKPCGFKAAADAPWIVPEKAEGTVTGHEELGVVLDGKALKEGAELEGTLQVTDTASGTAYPVHIAAKVIPAFEFSLSQHLKYRTGGGSGAVQFHEVTLAQSPVFNVPVGGSETKEYLLANRTAARQSWKLESSHEWVKLEPASGELAAESSIPVKIIVTPKDKQDAAYETTLTLTACGGAATSLQKIATYVIPPYERPAVPEGEAVYLNDLDQQRFVKSHEELGGNDKGVWYNGQERTRPIYHRCRTYVVGERLDALMQYKGKEKDYEVYPYTMSGKTFTHGFWVFPHHETVYSIAGSPFSAFAAEVGFWDKARGSARVCFEVYVDGKLRAQSGVMGVKDPSRLLVVDKLDGAKELKLVTRLENLGSDELCLATWGDPRFIKAK